MTAQAVSEVNTIEIPVLTEAQRTLFEKLERNHRTEIYKLARKMSGNSDDAEDLTQETFVNAYRWFSGYTAENGFMPWAYRILYRNFINLLRKRKPTASLDYKDSNYEWDTLLDSRHDESPGPEESALSGVLSGPVSKVLMDLPTDYRAAILLLAEDKSYAQIAKETKVAIGTVRSRISRSRTLMREALPKQGYRIPDRWNEEPAEPESEQVTPVAKKRAGRNRTDCVP